MNQNYDLPAYIPITSWALCAPELTPTEKLLLMIVNIYREFRPDYQSLQEAFNLSQSTIRKSIQNLERFGYIEVIKNDGRGKSYRIVRGW